MELHYATALRRTSIILTIAAALFASPPVRADETPPPAAPPVTPAGNTPPPAPTGSDPLTPGARREEKEGQGAPSLASRLKAFLGKDGVAVLHGQITSLTAERNDLQAQVATLTTERNNAVAERDRLQAQFAEIEAALTEQRDTVRATATEIASTVGMPAASLPAPAGEDAGEKPNIEALAKAVRDAKTSEERMKVHAAWLKATEDAERK